MKTEQIEAQVDQVFKKIKDVQKKVMSLQKQAKALLRKNEVKARGSLEKVFDDGLTLLGQGMIVGRKATESFVAETHRKAKKLELPEASQVKVSEVIPADVKPIKKNAKIKTHASKSVSPHAKIKNKSRSARAHLTAAVRSH